MKYLINIIILTSLILGLGCHQLTNSNENKTNDEEISNQIIEEKAIIHNGKKFGFIKNSNSNSKLYKSKDGHRLIIISSNNKLSTAKKGKTPDNGESVYRFKDSQSAIINKYDFDLFRNVGFWAEFDNTIFDETFRSKIDFSSLENVLPAGANIESLGLEVRKTDPFGGNNTPTSERNGTVEISAFPSTNAPNSGSSTFFNLVETGNSYFSVTTSSDNFFGKTLTSGQFFNDLSDVLTNNEDLFSVALKSQSETSSGALFSIDSADLLIEYTEAPVASSTPSLSSPGDDSFQEQSILFDWNASTGTAPITYQLQVDDNSNFSSPYSNTTGISGTSKTVSSLSRNTTYYWRVRSSNQVGTSGWSVVRSVKIRPEEPNVTATVQALAPKLTWNSIAGATEYGIWRISNKPGVSTTYFTTTQTEYQDFSIPFEAETGGNEFHYRVTAINSQDWPSLQASPKYYSEKSGSGGIRF